MIAAAVVTVVILNLLALAICSDSKRRDEAAARRRHPSNHREFQTAEVADLRCEDCGQTVYRVATTGPDLLVVLMAERLDFDYAVDWHRQFECGRIPV
jgi:hypothetical protein